MFHARANDPAESGANRAGQPDSGPGPGLPRPVASRRKPAPDPAPRQDAGRDPGGPDQYQDGARDTDDAPDPDAGDQEQDPGLEYDLGYGSDDAPRQDEEHDPSYDPGPARRGPAYGTRPAAPRPRLLDRLIPGRSAAPGAPAARRSAAEGQIVPRPLINPRLRADPRFGIWLSRIVIAVVIYAAVTIWLGFRFGLSATVVYVIADIIFRSRTMAVIPPAARVTTAQRATRRRLRIQQPAGYLSIHARRLPGTKSVVDHVVVGPAGVFVVDSEHWDRRLPVKAKGGKLFHGGEYQVGRLEHAKWEAANAATQISAELGRRVKVRPAMVVYGPAIAWTVLTLEGVDVMDAGHLSYYFRRLSKATATEGRQLGSEQIAEIFAAASRALPPISETSPGS